MLVTFVGPLVTQDRNAHSYLADLDAEQQLYERSGKLISYLHDWRYFHTEPTLQGALERLYADLYERGIVEWKDVELIQLWLSALDSVGYDFPSFDSVQSADDLTQCNLHEGRAQSAATIPRTPSTNSDANEKRLKIDNVVLVGQFNYNTQADVVSHWIKRWSEVFKHIDVRGPFNSTNMEALRRSGVNAFWADDDKGFYSPMTTMAESLQLYANNTTIRGVIMAHDDLLFNITHLVELGFPSESIITTSGADFPSTPRFTVYGNSTLRLFENATLWSTSQYPVVLDNWMWWKRTLSRAVAACHESDSEKYMDESGGIALFRNGLSDFLYVPTSISNEFVPHAEWMARNLIFLEIGTPTIVGRLKNQFNVNVRSANVCTRYGRTKYRVTSWLPSCLNQWTDSNFGMYHPVKMGRTGLDKWDVVFDAIVLGRPNQFLSDVQCPSRQARAAAATDTSSEKAQIDCIMY
jgi:hypothetical protein